MINSLLANKFSLTNYVGLFLLEFNKAALDAFFPEKYGICRPYRKLFGLETHFGGAGGKNADKNSLKQSLQRLRKLGMIEKEKSLYKLTNFGKRLFRKGVSRKLIAKKKWDGKYRVVIFDIPEKKRFFRDWLRYELYSLKYSQLQKSVFIGKYPLPGDVIEEIRKYKMERCVNYLVTDDVFDRRNMG